MPYIGKQPVVGNFQVCDAISVVNGQAAYTMQVASTNVSPESAFHMLVSLNGVLQKPGSSFTISGSTITFESNLVTNDVIDFIILLGDVLNIGTPSDDTVATASIQANAITAAKLNNDIISGQTALTAEPDDTDEFLVSDAGTIKRIDYSLIKGGGITVADQFRLTTNYTSANQNVIAANIERVDTAGQAGMTDNQMSESSGIFTFPLTGIYLVIFQGILEVDGALASNAFNIEVTTDNSSYTSVAETRGSLSYISGGSVVNKWSGITQTLVDVTDTSNVKVRFQSTTGSSPIAALQGSSTENLTSMTFIRLGDT